jgi:acetoin utilization deacetylase AcuC-like enzyme
VQRMISGEVSETEMRRIGFPWSAQMVERSRRSSGATMAALRAAIEEKNIAVNLAGGTHHAAYDRGGGYCVFNDAVIAARCAQSFGLVKRVLVIDLDVHHGNGTASLCANDESIFTFSMHHEKNYPAIKPSSNLDVPLKPGVSDAEYLDLLAKHLPQVLQTFQPQAVIYLAGADPFIDDRLGGLALSKLGLAERDRYVMASCRAFGLPVAITMAGGYAQNVADIVDIHSKTVSLASNFYTKLTGEYLSNAAPIMSPQATEK